MDSCFWIVSTMWLRCHPSDSSASARADISRVCCFFPLETESKHKTPSSTHLHTQRTEDTTAKGGFGYCTDVQ